MAIYVALLKGINVGGHRKVAMADLRAMLADLGLTGVRSLLASGNLVFRTTTRPTAQLERLLETESRTRLGLATDYIVRSAAEWGVIVEQNPFPKEAKRDPAHLLVMCLRVAPPPGAVRALRGAIVGRESVELLDRAAYLVFPDGIGDSKLTNSVIEKHLGAIGTSRNWNTVLKLQALLDKDHGR